MLKIGEFSRLSQVTVKTLHHYDDIRLLKPAHVDRSTGHRFYTLEQLPRIHRIMALKELGLSLEQIARMIHEELPTERLRGMLTLKEAEAQQRIEEEMARLARIKFHIRQIDMEATMSQLDIRIKSIEPVRALTLRILAKDHGDIVSVGMEMFPVLEQHNLNPMKTGNTPFQIVYAKEYAQENVDFEFVLPVSDTWQGDMPLDTAGTFTVREVPGIPEAATYIYTGNIDDIDENLVNVERWVATNGYKLSDEVRMVMLRGPFHRLPYDEWMMEIQYPLEKA